ncbi:uncharacterized protein Z518_00007 [Rhinocladiella mackenziei CBS 650.93]|uniref:DUF7066 domain-containing protein n=1 Tax=Rhinocladiella mackenziei CBS 650.93 TaxID=1442369 RepID=A0A0D2ISG6_9EURO|nr:uncharacterized protein Z518_00007 [Rhinocladiella mackenziei CBS 650.93]KIX08929.1 hypothetical protein Z518_00007 [Rhinocladiella mackenziei CBS 650.93]
MAINWKLRETVFQLLAAVYAELGEEAFKGRYMSIARYFGPDATYDSIKSFFAKEVSKGAAQLKAQNPEHHGSGKGIPHREPAGPSRPPLLYFNDEDISIVTEREAKTHPAHSLRAPAKRPRVIAASQMSSADEDVIYCATISNKQPAVTHDTGSSLAQSTETQDPTNSTAVPDPPPNPGPSSYVTAPSQNSHEVSEKGNNRSKRPYSTIDESMNTCNAQSLQQGSDGTPKPESFGYVTNQGQYRCALCLSQLPNQEDLERHESMSKEHLHNLRNAIKVSKGRAKLAQVTTVPRVGQHHSTSVPSQPLRLGSVENRDQVFLNGETSEFKAQRDSINHSQLPNYDHNRQKSPMDTIDVRGGTPNSSPVPVERGLESTAPVPHSEMSESFHKGKDRALSLPSEPSHNYPRPCPELSTVIQSRPTTAQTEIGTLTSPDVKQPSSKTNCEPKFSPAELAEIMRSTEMMIQLMGCMQREAASLANSAGKCADSNPLPSPQVDSGGNAPAQSQTTASSPPTLISGNIPSSTARPGPSVDSRTLWNQVRRKKGKDTGEEVIFIALD